MRSFRTRVAPHILVIPAALCCVDALHAQSIGHTTPAESRLTLSGAVDLAIGHVTNKNAAGVSASSTEVHPNGNAGSLFRLRGREELGGGMFAGFWLEGVTQPDVGTMTDNAGRLWNRTSAVYVGGPWGEIGIGRLIAPTFTSTAVYDPVFNNGYVQASKLISTLGSNTDYLFRNDNAVSYFLPKGFLGGVTGHIQVAAGEHQDNKGYKGFRLAYVSGPIDVGIAAGTGKTLPGQPNFTIKNIGASYDFGVVQPMAFIERVTFGSLDQNVYQVGAIVPIQAHTLRLSYTKAIGTGSATVGTNATSFGASFVYSLSKRTAIYTNWARIINTGPAAFRVVPSSNTASSRGGTSTGFDIGVRHYY